MFAMNWCKGLKAKVNFNEPLKRHSTFKIGGAAEFFVQPQAEEDLKTLLKAIKKNKLKVRVIGAGSNLLVSDKGVRGVVIKLDSPYFKKISFRQNTVYAAAGSLLAELISKARQHSLSGVEFFTGIPATVGGALAMNAGANKRFITDLVEGVKVMDYNGKVKILKKKDITFGYRNSSLARYIILGVAFKLTKSAKPIIRKRIKDLWLKRKAKQDWSFPSAGCIFKNPGKFSAGKLIDLCGLKGRSAGGACVSLKHANFIINKGNATASDVLKLIKLIKHSVKNKFNINLQPEVAIWK